MIKSNNNLANDEELLGVGRVTINGKRPSPLVCSMPVRNLDPKILRIVRSFKDKALFLEGGITGSRIAEGGTTFCPDRDRLYLHVDPSCPEAFYSTHLSR